MPVQTATRPIASINLVPEHVAIIPDGNRRWASQKRRDLLETYTIGANALDNCIDYAVERGVRNVTIWPTSTRIWWRSDCNVQALIAAVQFQLDMAQKTYPPRGFRYRTIGRLDRFNNVAPELVARLNALEQATASLMRANVTMAFDYDGQDEITRALRKIIDKNIPSEQVSPELIGDHLDTAGLPDPDLIIRTGGDLRLSGFLPFQARYAEISVSRHSAARHQPGHHVGCLQQIRAAPLQPITRCGGKRRFGDGALLRPAHRARRTGIGNVIGIEPGIAAPAVLVVVGHALVGERHHLIERAGAARDSRCV